MKMYVPNPYTPVSAMEETSDRAKERLRKNGKKQWLEKTAVLSE